MVACNVLRNKICDFFLLWIAILIGLWYFYAIMERSFEIWLPFAVYWMKTP